MGGKVGGTRSITRMKKDGARRKTEIKPHRGWKPQSGFRMRKKAAKNRWEGGMKGVSTQEEFQERMRASAGKSRKRKSREAQQVSRIH